MDQKKIGVVIASLGNFAVSFCHYAAKMNVPVTVVIPSSVPLTKVQRCHGSGAKVLMHGQTLVDAEKYARIYARERTMTFINGHDHPNVLAGYATVAKEIVEQMPNVDAILVPVGRGGLAAAVVTVVKQLKPNCLVYGVQPKANPIFFKSLEVGEPVQMTLQPTQAEGIAVPTVGANSFHICKPLLDKMLLVEEDWISRAVLHIYEKEYLTIEGAAACPLAAIIGHLVPELKTKNVVCILTSGNIDGQTLSRCAERALSAEGRLIKFSVRVPDTVAGVTSLLKLLEAGFYNIKQMDRNRCAYEEEDVFYADMTLTCETRNLEHALDLKRMLERTYSSTKFVTDPFKDKTTCPCFVRKPISYP